MNLSTKILLAVSSGAVAAAMAVRAAGSRRFSFEGRSVLITGSRGLALVMARQLAAQGARLTLVARSSDELERAASELSSKGAEVQAFPCDVRNRQEDEEAVQRVIDRFGRIDVLINNAGVIQVGPLEHMQISDFENAMGVHFWGPLYLTLAALPHMRRQGGGRIVNIASIGGKIAVPHMLPYSASKFALVGLSDGLRAELAKDNIRVTTVCPGLMRTGSHVNAMFKGQHEDEYTWFSLSAGMPLLSKNAEGAARQILKACRRGKSELIITPQARMLPVIGSILPGLIAKKMQITNRLLPGPAGRGQPSRQEDSPVSPAPETVSAESGDQSRPGSELESRWALSFLTRLGQRASVENNELPPTPEKEKEA
ncbi:MAG: SDR family NAD(P)-dependent oxidoreductase [Acidobacteriota bacterium]